MEFYPKELWIHKEFRGVPSPVYASKWLAVPGVTDAVFQPEGKAGPVQLLVKGGNLKFFICSLSHSHVACLMSVCFHTDSSHPYLHKFEKPLEAISISDSPRQATGV